MSETPEHPPLDPRKAAILKAVVEEHIATGQPVGSQHVTAAHGVRVSSATVRNEMSVLEREGYLTHPHTSAGRVPTDRGYRFFVDGLDAPGALADVQTQQVNEFFRTTHGELENLLERTARLLSRLTDHAAVVMAPKQESASIRSVLVVGLGLGTGSSGMHIQVALLVVVMSSGAIEKHTLELDADTSESQLAAATSHLSAGLVGRSVRDALFAPVLHTGDRLTDAACDNAMAELDAQRARDGSEGELFVGGASRMAAAFDAIEVVRDVLASLEQQYVMVSLLRETLDRAGSVSIGTEHGADGFESLSTCSVVVAPYAVQGRRVGTIGVLGPTRMNYPQAMAVVNTVGERLSHRFSEG